MVLKCIMWSTSVIQTMLAVANVPFSNNGDLQGTTNLGCAALEAILADKTFQPGQEVYNYEASQFWSNTEILNPACIFRPSSANDVAAAVLAARLTSSKFAVRGGGHMAIKAGSARGIFPKIDFR